MGKIGLYVFTDMIKKRCTKKRETYFDGLNYIGLRYIVSEIDLSKWDITYVSKNTINTVDFVLISVQSYYDIINIINELHGVKKTCKIIAGGPGLNNVKLLRDIVDFAIIGRGENIINKILSGQFVDGVWYKDGNYDFKTNIDIFTLKHFIEIDDKYIGKYTERSVGCKKKCYFCEYSWKNKYVSKASDYQSGIMDRETIFNDLDWAVYKNKDIVTAIDGATEKTRTIINKPLNNEMIVNKLLEINNHDRDYFSLKLYCLLGYPFEKCFEPQEMIENINSVNKSAEKRCNILMVSPHFIPMPFTPMECEPVNFFNFRNAIKNSKIYNKDTNKVKIFWPWSLASGPISAAEATILNRCNDAEIIKKVLCSKKYNAFNSEKKKLCLFKYYEDIIGRVESVLPYVNRNYNTEKAKKNYFRKIMSDL